MAHRGLAAALALAACLFAPVSAGAFSTGPLPDKNKICGHAGACTECHRSGPPCSVTPAIQFLLAGPPEAPLPATYTPGANYDLLIRAVETNPTRCVGPGGACGFGIELSVVKQDCVPAPPKPIVQAGCLDTLGNPLLRFVCGGGTGASGSCSPACAGLPDDVDFLEHAAGGILPDTGTLDRKTWRFGWTAPPAGTGPVTFYYAINFVNMSGDPSGDTPCFQNRSLDEEIIGPADCDLLRGSIASLTPPINKTGPGGLFGDAVSCAPKPVPETVGIPAFTGGASVQPLTQRYDDASVPLLVYEVDCPCTGKKLYLTKEQPLDPATARMDAHWLP